MDCSMDVNCASRGVIARQEVVSKIETDNELCAL